MPSLTDSAIVEELRELMEAHPEHREVLAEFAGSRMLTADELNTLATRHANNHEASKLRDRLLASGLHFCTSCKAIKPSESFNPSQMGRGGRRNCCSYCDSGKRRRKSGYEPLGYRYEIHRKWIEQNREKVQTVGRRFYHANKTLTGPRPKLVSKPVSKRRNYDKRIALGMAGRQANYMEPLPPALQAIWDSNKEH